MIRRKSKAVVSIFMYKAGLERAVRRTNRAGLSSILPITTVFGMPNAHQNIVLRVPVPYG